jgi:hypothetical protein
MKNIHILPTDKPSRLFFNNNKFSKKFELTKGRAFLNGITNTQNHNIYITSDEEIKANVYCLINKVLCKTELLDGRIVSRQLVGGGTMDICKSEYLEIILTTDEDLIKDGVQAIDDEFLEWFVKNPSCEDVETFYSDKDLEGYWRGIEEYQIIIPKEEPKQRLEKYSERFENDKSPIGNPDTWGKRIVEEPKKETLEEVAERYANESFIPIKNLEGVPLRIPAGQSVPCGFTNHKKASTKHFINGAKWQQERSYNEEEVIDLLKALQIGYYIHNERVDIDKWFKQFKKK